MIKIHIKPLSVNRCWQGRRFKTKEYMLYEKEALLKLPSNKLQPGPYHLDIRVGFSNKLADIDNFCKPWIDLLQKKYKFNDREIVKLTVNKVLVPKKKEFIEFDLIGNQTYEIWLK